MIIKKAEFVQSAVEISKMPADNRREYMFCGRSNVGKSSFINMITNRKSLARTSQKPGKTQTLNIYGINDDIYFIDVPGYGYAAVSKSIKETFGKMIEKYVINRQQLKKVFLLVDFRHEPTADDVTMYNFLQYYNHEIIIIATKGDKVKRSQYFKNLKMIKEKFGISVDGKVIVTSSETRMGVEEVLKELDEE